MNSAKVFHAGIFWLHTRLDNHKVLKWRLPYQFQNSPRSWSRQETL